MTANKWRFTGERLVPGNRWLAPMRVENLARFQFFCKRASGRWILDLGCGAGEGTAYLHQHRDWRVIGVDLAHEALVIAQQEYQESGAGFARADVQHLPFSQAHFDGVISVEVIEHIEDAQAYLQEVARVLRPGGIFMLTTPNRLRSSPTPGSLWPEHVREYSPTELYRILSAVFGRVELWGEHIPVYEIHPMRRLLRHLAPLVKPWLPHWLRVHALPIVQATIKSKLHLDDIRFTQVDLDEQPTLVAWCGR